MLEVQSEEQICVSELDLSTSNVLPWLSSSSPMHLSIALAMATSEKTSLGQADPLLPPAVYGVLLHLCVVLIGSIAIGFTSPTSRLRYAALVAQISILYSMDASWGASLHWNFAASFLAQHTVSTILQYITTAILSQWSYQHRGPAKPISYQHGSPMNSIHAKSSRKVDARNEGHVEPTEQHFKLIATVDRLAFGYNAMQAYRMLNTPYEARNTPRFSRSSSDYVPSKRKFMVSTFARFVVCYLVLDAMRPGSSEPSSSTGSDGNLTSPLYIPFFRRFSEVTLAEVGTRVGVTAATYIAGQASLTSIYDALALLSVGTGCSAPADWRPLFGSPRDASTLRGLWNSTWHQLSRIKYAAVGRIVTYTWFGCKPKGLAGRYVFVVLVFMGSGLHHFMGDRAEGVPWLGSGNFTFFSTQALGIVLEDLVQALWSRSGAPVGNSYTSMLGYVWVLCFMSWSLPMMVYKSIATRVEPTSLVPWSILGYLRNSYLK